LKAVCIIPARMGSVRFPGKPLAPLLGMPLVLHVWNRCQLCQGFERVVVATCDPEIREAVEENGGEAVMTATTHERATDRVREAVALLDLSLTDDDFVLMVQGDEVLMAPAMADKMLATFARGRPPVVNLAARFHRIDDYEDPNTVKVVAASDGRALYFSRAPIPSRARTTDFHAFQQTGVIGFSWSFLRRFSELPQTPLEKTESVDMLRVVEHGYDIRLVFTDAETIGVDTEADRARAEKFLRTDPVTQLYLGSRTV